MFKVLGFHFILFFIPRLSLMALMYNRDRTSETSAFHLSTELSSSLKTPDWWNYIFKQKKGKKSLDTLSFLIRINYTSRYWRYMKCCSLLFRMEPETISVRDQALAIKEHDSFKPNPVLLRAQRSAFDSWQRWHFLKFSRGSSCQ